MKILTASYILTFDENFTILKDGCIVFDEKIIELASYDITIKKYPNIEIISLGENSVLMPGLINSHIHLEFSANKTTLKYGSFYSWLNSVIRHREKLIEKANSGNYNEIIMALNPNIEGDTTIFYITKKITNKQLKITTIARGISFGGELEYTDELTLARSLATRRPFENYMQQSE